MHIAIASHFISGATLGHPLSEFGVGGAATLNRLLRNGKAIAVDGCDRSLVKLFNHNYKVLFFEIGHTSIHYRL